VVSTIIKYTLESFSECTSVSNVVEVGRKSVPGGWATVPYHMTPPEKKVQNKETDLARKNSAANSKQEDSDTLT